MLNGRPERVPGVLGRLSSLGVLRIYSHINVIVLMSIGLAHGSQYSQYSQDWPVCSLIPNYYGCNLRSAVVAKAVSRVDCVMEKRWLDSYGYVYIWVHSVSLWNEIYIFCNTETVKLQISSLIRESIGLMLWSLNSQSVLLKKPECDVFLFDDCCLQVVKCVS